MRTAARCAGIALLPARVPPRWPGSAAPIPALRAAIAAGQDLLPGEVKGAGGMTADYGPRDMPHRPSGRAGRPMNWIIGPRRRGGEKWEGEEIHI